MGKTYLIEQTFSGRFTFQHAGLSPEAGEKKGLLKKQLQHFYHSLEQAGMQKERVPKDWLEAFYLLEKFLQQRDDGSRQLVFLDELPWMDTPRSGFIQALEAFWNGWGSHRENLMMIVCGSATSWMQSKLINNHGGLYDRVTYEIRLAPFTLLECERFYQQREIRFSRYDIVQSYMILGGIPYYMNYMDRELSLARNVDHLFFERGAVLRNEYSRLFMSLFTSPEEMMAIVQLLSSRNVGFTRSEIVQRLGISDGGKLSHQLRALIDSDFVVKYVPFGLGKREAHYKLVDLFCLFYLHFLGEKQPGDEQFWLHSMMAQPVVTWRGLSFENVCFNHIAQIKKALGISGVLTTSSAWTKRGAEDPGTQIDLLITRKDNVINMCECKYYGDNFAVDGSYYRTLLRRQEILAQQVSRRMVVRSTLITTYGLVHNEYSGAFSNVVTMDDLFAEV